MRFSDFQNQSPLQLRQVDTSASPAEVLAVPIRSPKTFWQSIEKNVDVRLRRFGPMLVTNLLLVCFIVAYISMMDLQKFHAGSKRSVLWRWPFLMLLGFNLLVALGLYVFLAETEQVRWDNSISAIIIGFGYAAMVKSTLFQTQAGQSIGLADLYNKTVSWINDQIMIARSRKYSAVIYYIAYRNTRDYMMGELRNIYLFATSEDRRQELIGQLEEKIKKESTIIEQRRVCAEHLLKLISWRQLDTAQLIERGKKRSSIKHPKYLVTVAVNHIVKERGSGNARMWLYKKVQRLIDADTAINPTRGGQEKDRLEQELMKSPKEQSDHYVLIRWLFVYYLCREESLLKAGLLPTDYQEQLIPGRRHWFESLPLFSRTAKSTQLSSQS